MRLTLLCRRNTGIWRGQAGPEKLRRSSRPSHGVTTDGKGDSITKRELDVRCWAEWRISFVWINRVKAGTLKAPNSIWQINNMPCREAPKAPIFPTEKQMATALWGRGYKGLRHSRSYPLMCARFHRVARIRQPENLLKAQLTEWYVAARRQRKSDVKVQDAWQRRPNRHPFPDTCSQESLSKRGLFRLLSTLFGNALLPASFSRRYVRLHPLKVTLGNYICTGLAGIRRFYQFILEGMRKGE